MGVTDIKCVWSDLVDRLVVPEKLVDETQHDMTSGFVSSAMRQLFRYEMGQCFASLINQAMILADQVFFVGAVAVKTHLQKAGFRYPYLTEHSPEAEVGTIIRNKRCRSHSVFTHWSHGCRDTLGWCCYRNVSSRFCFIISCCLLFSFK